MRPFSVASNTSAAIQTAEKQVGSRHSQKNAIGSDHANTLESFRIVELMLRIQLDSRAASATACEPGWSVSTGDAAVSRRIASTLRLPAWSSVVSLTERSGQRPATHAAEGGIRARSDGAVSRTATPSCLLATPLPIVSADGSRAALIVAESGLAGEPHPAPPSPSQTDTAVEGSVSGVGKTASSAPMSVSRWVGSPRGRWVLTV